jgi:hypothetical protein
MTRVLTFSAPIAFSDLSTVALRSAEASARTKEAPAANIAVAMEHFPIM